MWSAPFCKPLMKTFNGIEPTISLWNTPLGTILQLNFLQFSNSDYSACFSCPHCPLICAIFHQCISEGYRGNNTESITKVMTNNYCFPPSHCRKVIRLLIHRFPFVNPQIDSNYSQSSVCLEKASKIIPSVMGD